MRRGKGEPRVSGGAVHGPSVGSASARHTHGPVRLAVYLLACAGDRDLGRTKVTGAQNSVATATSLPHRLAQPWRCYRAENTLTHMYRQWSSLIRAAVNTNDVINRRPARLAQTIE